MLKEEYLSKLKTGLTEAGIEDADERVEYYDEMICDRIEAGMSEERAVEDMEDIDSIINDCRLDKPVTTLIVNKVQKSHDKAKKSGNGFIWVLLAILGFPIWLPLLIVLFSLLLTIYILMWSSVIVIFAILISIAAVGLASLATFIVSFAGIVPWQTGLLALGASLFFGGLTVLLFGPGWSVAKSIAGVVPNMFKKIKALFV